MYPLTDRIADLSAVWKQISIVFPCFDQKPLDWDALYRAFLPKVMAAENALDFHLLLAEFVNTLNDGHTDYSLPYVMQQQRGFLPFSLRMAKGVYCIDAAVPALSAALYQPIRTFNGTPLSALLASLSRFSYHIGSFLPSWRLHQLLPFFLKPRGNTLETDSGAFCFDLLGDKPALCTPAPSNRAHAFRQIAVQPLDIRLYDNRFIYVRLDSFMEKRAAAALTEALDQLPPPDGMILDLRENIGGMTLHAAELAQLLIPDEFHACSKRTRSTTGVGLPSASQLIRWKKEDIDAHIAAGHSTAEEIADSFSLLRNTHYDRYTDTFGAKGRPALYTGRCILLTSRHTVSAAEDFTAMFRTNQRGLILGTPTCGTSGTPLLQTLSCGGRLRVCSVGYQLLDGTEFIGSGITPDILIENSPEDLRSGRDRTFEKALSMLANSAC